MQSVESRSRATAFVFVAVALVSIGVPHTLLLSAGASVLLTTHGIEALPIVYLGVGVMLIPFGWLVARMIDAVDAETALLGVLTVRAAAALVIFVAWSLGFESLVAYAAPIWARVDVIIGLVALFRVSYKIFDLAEDKSWLVAVAACEPASSLLTGLAAPFLLSGIDIGGMFLLAAVSLAVATPLAQKVRKDVAADPVRWPARPRRRHDGSRLALSPDMRSYLIWVAAAMTIWTVAHFLLDALFHGLVAGAFAGEARRFTVFSYALAAAGFISLLRIGFGERRFLRRIGVRLLLVLLPTVLLGALALGTAAAFAFGSLFVLFLIVVVMKTLEYAVITGFYARAWRSLLAPLPPRHGVRLVAAAERNVHAIGAGLAAMALIAIFGRVASGAGDGAGADAIWLIVAVIVLLSLLGLAISRMVQRGYGEAVERALMRRQKFGEVDMASSGRRSRAAIQRMLREGEGRDVIEAARLQAELDPDGFVNMAPRLIARGEREIVSALVETVEEIARPELFPPMAGRLTVEEDPALRDALLTAAAATRHPRSPRLLAKA
ncbi:MAG: hypothetical protein AAF360_09100, partial [Pseudomonadota bacterium]